MTATTTASTPAPRRPGQLVRRVLRRLAIHVVCGVFAAVPGGVWCLPPVSPHDDGFAATASALLLGMVTVLAVVRRIRCRGHGARHWSTQDGAR
jgi:hypothetical protein